MSSEVIIHCEKDIYSPGEVILGMVSWDCKKTPSNILISLNWRTEGRGTTDKGCTSSEELLCSSSSGKSRFELRVPANCPSTYRGKLVSLMWTVNARVDLSWARDPKSEYEIIVSKTGEALSIPSEFKAAKSDQS